MPKIQYVVGFLFSPGRKIVLLLQKNRPEWQLGMWNGPGGKLEPGETPAAAMQREFFEETGLDIGAWEQYAELSGLGFQIFFFRAFSGMIWVGKSMTDELVDRFSIDDLPERLMTNATWLIPMALSMDLDRAAGFAVQEIAA
jgi:8-oxo-dGTP pyrophosphatase MutT (NUDIX family)